MLAQHWVQVDAVGPALCRRLMLCGHPPPPPPDHSVPIPIKGGNYIDVTMWLL